MHGRSKAVTENLIQSLLSKRANANLFQWWHLFIILYRLFKRLRPLCLAISSFSFKHKGQLFVFGLDVCCF